MQNEIQNNKKRNVRASMDDRLTADDRIGMFEAGLEELSKCFTFDAMNAEGGVVLTIKGLKRTDMPDGSWHFDPLKEVNDGSTE